MTDRTTPRSGDVAASGKRAYGKPTLETRQVLASVTASVVSLVPCTT